MLLRSALFVLVATTASAQTGVAPTRTWEELRQETQARAERNAYPVAGLPPAEVAEALSRIASLDPDQWAGAFSAIGQRHFERAEYLLAWRFFSFAAWPATISAGKRDAYRRSVDAFRKYAALSASPPETVRIPFEGSEIVAYLGLPAGARPAPLVMLIAGLDSRKENGAERGPAYLARGLGYLALDLPGTGESQVKVDADAVRVFSRVLDWLQTRRDIDAARIAAQGSSWGSYWAARIAFVERARLRGTVVQGGPVHGYFQPEWQRKALQTREYLFDLFAARAGLYGTGTLDAFLAWGPRLSLQAAGILDQPSARMLLVNGEKDSQVPIDDLYLLLHHGSPKEAWVNPQGGHMGRSRDWPDERIFREIVLPWLENLLHK